MLRPEERKTALANRVEGQLGSMLEDLVAGVWAVCGLTYDDEEQRSEVRDLTLAIMNRYEIERFGSLRSRFIPSRMIFEGEDETLEDRITEYLNLAHKHEQDLRRDLVIVVGLVFLFTRTTPADVLHLWSLTVMKRHSIPLEAFMNKPALVACGVT